MRRPLLVLVILGLSLASLHVPAAGQTAPPPVRITVVSPACAPLDQPVEVRVGGTSAPGARGSLVISTPSGTAITKGTWFDDNQDGRWVSNRDTPLSFRPTANGYYRIVASDGSTSDFAYFSAPCRRPRVVLDPNCSVAGRPTSLTVSAFDFAPNDAGDVYYDSTVPKRDGNSRTGIPTDGAGNFATTAAYKSSPFSVTPPDRDVPIHVEDLKGNVIDVLWLRCPPPGVTTTTSTTVPFVPDPTPDPVETTTTQPVTIPSTTVVTLPPDPGPATTTTSVVPPSTPGASLSITPAIGPPGFVTLAQGAGFPPGPVTLTWAPGLGFTPATAGPDGTFAVRVLVFPRDRLGLRLAVATGAGVSANAPFLVVPPTVQPSGSDVAQITRIRRFTQR